jgi:hypothetical protein
MKYPLGKITFDLGENIRLTSPYGTQLYLHIRYRKRNLKNVALCLINSAPSHEDIWGEELSDNHLTVAPQVCEYVCISYSSLS